MANENDEAAIQNTFSGVRVPEPTDMEQLQSGYRNLLSRVCELEKMLDNARREVSETRWSVRLLRNATTDLLWPIMVIGWTGFLLGWIEADNWWDYGVIGVAGIFGIYWLRLTRRGFDEVTIAP